MDLQARIGVLRERVVALERALWDGGLNEALLAPWQAAFRELEALLGQQGGARRHHFVIVVPVADSPAQLGRCLDSLKTLCRTFAYGGVHDGRYPGLSLLLADDSTQAGNIARHRELAQACEAAGIATSYFGVAEQLAFLQDLGPLGLEGVIGSHPASDFGHKGQAMMRNIAYLKLAAMQAAMPDERLLFYTVDADQQFCVNVPGTPSGRALYAVNYLYHLDALFDAHPVQLVTGKVVGDPPVSPAVMAGRFLDDVIAYLHDIAACDAAAAYRQPEADTRGSGEAAYHDMAELFGFAGGDGAYRYRCGLPGTPDNARCFDDFSRRLNGFFHGGHPTRITWYRYRPVADSVEPARTIYTGNYVFSPAALDWFIPFAPLRLRMSGPTMGRMLRAALGGCFVSANVPMLHRRTLDETGQSEYRPGVVDGQRAVDLGDEFERQFFGDVMLFAMERLAAQGFPGEAVSEADVRALLDAVRVEMREKYHARQGLVADRLALLAERLREPSQWWNRTPGLTDAVQRFEAFMDNITRNFAAGSPGLARIDAAQNAAAWCDRQAAAIARFHADREAWQGALDHLRAGPGR